MIFKPWGSALLGLSLLGLPPLPAQAVGADQAATTPVTKTYFLALGSAGTRLVAVGEQGQIVLAEPTPAPAALSWTPARSATPETLTAVSFGIGGKRGWASGHRGTILCSEDGGSQWQDCSPAPRPEGPLLSLHFLDDAHGFAVGAFGTCLETLDGGKTWQTVALGRDDRHLNSISGVGNTLHIAGEKGLLLRSVDGGRHWTPLKPPRPGSWFRVLQTAPDQILLLGFKGEAYLSLTGGRQWTGLKTGSSAPLLGGDWQGQQLGLVTGDGQVLWSGDGGQHFRTLSTARRGALSDLKILPDGRLLMAGEAGLQWIPRP